MKLPAGLSTAIISLHGFDAKISQMYVHFSERQNDEKLRI
jgi:hypothetical protein